MDTTLCRFSKPQSSTGQYSHSSTFLCQDYLERDAFDFSQISLDNVETAIQTQPECVTCHASLDPLAMFLGLSKKNINLSYDQQGVASSFKQRWFAGLTETQFLWAPLNNLSELGAYTASDARFAQCMVEQTWNFFVESHEIDDLEKLDLTQVFVSSDYSIKELVQHIVQAPEYVQQEQRVLRPEQLLETILQMSNMENEDTRLSLLVWSPEHRVMFGSIDNLGVLTANPSFTVGHHLVLEWLTKELSGILEQDLLTQNVAERVLLTEARQNSTSENQILHGNKSCTLKWSMLQIVRSKRWSICGVMSIRNEGELSAWSTVLAVLLHDPRAVLR